jgi:hypothetical protein
VSTAKDLEPRGVGPLVPLSKDEVALVEAKAHAVGLPSLMSLAEGLDDDDIPFPLDAVDYDNPFGDGDLSLDHMKEDDLWQ